MANIQTHIDELINYPAKIINAIAESQEIVGLIFDDPDIDMSSELAESVRDHLYDYNYIDDTVQEDGVLIMVDSDIVDMPNPNIATIEVYIQIVVNKHYMRLDASKFKGVKGNRRDNITRQIDLLLRGRRDFGISRFELESAITASVPKKFTSKMLTYAVSDYGKNKELMKN